MLLKSVLVGSVLLLCGNDIFYVSGHDFSSNSWSPTHKKRKSQSDTRIYIMQQQRERDESDGPEDFFWRGPFYEGDETPILGPEDGIRYGLSDGDNDRSGGKTIPANPTDQVVPDDLEKGDHIANRMKDIWSLKNKKRKAWTAAVLGGLLVTSAAGLGIAKGTGAFDVKPGSDPLPQVTVPPTGLEDKLQDRNNPSQSPSNAPNVNNNNNQNSGGSNQNQNPTSNQNQNPTNQNPTSNQNADSQQSRVVDAGSSTPPAGATVYDIKPTYFFREGPLPDPRCVPVQSRLVEFADTAAACGQTYKDIGKYGVAIAGGKNHCGETITVQYEGRRVVLTVVDECPGCSGDNHIDASIEAMHELFGGDATKTCAIDSITPNVQWWFNS